MNYAGIDIGGTKIAAGLFDGNRRLITETEIPTMAKQGAERIANDVTVLIKRLLEAGKVDKETVPYIGIGCPGSVDSKSKVVKYANNLNFHDVPLGRMVEEKTGMPIMLENDANCAGLGEYLAMQNCQTVKSFFMVTLGTGVGTAFVYNGRLFTGFNGAAPEMGHCTLDANGPVCDCGQKGCWEVYCAGHSLADAAKKAAGEARDSLMWELAGGRIENIDGQIAFAAWRKKDQAATRVIERYIYYFKAGIANVINAFQPQVLTIGGGISRQGDLFLDAAREAIDKYSYCKILDRTEVRKAVLGTKAGIYGAAFLGA